jgi:hypothetical protein
MKKTVKETLFVALTSLFGLLPMLYLSPRAVYAAACTNHDTLGTGRSVSTIPAPTNAGPYRVWIRMAVPSTTADTVLMSIDTAGTTQFCGVTAGGTGFSATDVSDFNSNPPNIKWKWIDYRDGVVTSKMNVTLPTTGSIKVTVGGAEDGVAVDRILLISDGCVPDDASKGDNCVTTGSDTIDPTSNPIFPGASESMTSNTITIRSIGRAVIKPQVTDNVGVVSVTYKLGTSTVNLDASGNYTLPNQNGDYSFSIESATDAAGNTMPNRTINLRVRHPNIDRDTNNKVNIFDVLAMRTGWNTGNTQYDLDLSGNVNIFDILNYIKPNWTP